MRDSRGSWARARAGRPHPPWTRVAALSALWLLSIGLLPSCRQVASHTRTGVEVVATDIYRGADWTARLPVELVKDWLIQAGLSFWIGRLDLPDDVRQRVRARIRSEEFVDASVPFFLYLKEIYTAPYGGGGFEEHARKHFAAQRNVAGMEHSLFRFDAPNDSDSPGTEDKPEGGSLGALSLSRPEVIADLVRLYDALFLQTTDHPFERDVDRDPETTERTVSIVRGMLERFNDHAEEPPEFVAKLLADEYQLEALAVAVGDLLRSFTNKAYRRFARRAVRASQLEKWMTTELSKENAGVLWSYLPQANVSRRHAVLIVVDGLEGALVESLASGESENPFLQQVLEDSRAADDQRPREEVHQEVPPTAHAFLEAFATTGYTDGHYLPFFRRLYADLPFGVARVGTATTPTLSVRNIPIALTGAPVAGSHSTGLVNFQYLDRAKDRSYYFYGSDVLLLDSLTAEAGLKTLPGRLEHLSSMSANGYYDAEAHFALDGLVNLVVGDRRRDFGDRLFTAELEKRIENEKKLRKLRMRLLAVVEDAGKLSWWRPLARGAHLRRAQQLIHSIARLEDLGMPQLLIYYNPWPDHFAHYKGPFSDEILSPTGELNRLDYWLTQLDRLYRKAGVHDRTLFAMAGDHGLAPARFLVDVDEVVFRALAADGFDLRVSKNSADEGEPPRLIHAIRPPSMRNYDVVVSATAGGNYTMDFFKDQGDAWEQQPLHADLVHLKTLAGKRLDVVEEIRTRLASSLEYLVVREEHCDLQGGKVRLVATRNGRRVDEFITRRGNSIFYAATADLLETKTRSPYLAAPSPAREARQKELLDRAARAWESDVSTWLTKADWQELCAWTPKPDAVVQLAQLCNSDLVSTLNLFPKPLIAYNSVVPGRHGGEHFHDKNAFVGLWGAPVRRHERLESARIGSLAPTIFQYLTAKTIVPGTDGWGDAPIQIDTMDEDEVERRVHEDLLRHLRAHTMSAASPSP